MRSAICEKICRKFLWVANLCFIGLLAYTYSESSIRCTCLMSHIPVRSAQIDFVGDQKRVLLSVAITTLLSSSATSTKAFQPMHESALLPFSSAVGIFFTGYKLEAGQYRTLLASLSPAIKLTTASAADDADSSLDSLNHDANNVLSEVKLLGYSFEYLTTMDNVDEKDAYNHPPLLLMGHSRGGAVVALAATKYLKATRKMKGASSLNMDAHRPRILLVLVDPVDSAENTVLRALHESLRSYAGKDTINASGEQNPSWPWPALIISTPYGGYSSYYKTPYESACAPSGRNGAAFLKIMSESKVFESEQTRTAYLSTTGARQTSQSIIRDGLSTPPAVVSVVLSDVGHCQLLDDRRNSAIGSVCAANEKISDKSVQGFIQTLTSLWVSLSLTPYDADRELKIVEIKRKIKELYPNIRTIWSV